MYRKGIVGGMTTRVLPFDRNIIKQDTGYWCGPASAQIVLSSRNKYVDEAQLARECKTTTNGTDSVTNIERVLDVRLPEAKYTSVYRKGRSISERKTQFWWDCVRSIDNGYPVVLNFVVTAWNNRPRGIKGSDSPNYGVPTYHYVDAVGWSDEGNGGKPALLIGDPGFWPNVYWMDFEQVFSLIHSDDWKGYLFADLPLLKPAPPGSIVPPGIPVADAPPVATPPPTPTLPVAVKSIRDPFTGAIWSPNKEPRKTPGNPRWIIVHTQEGGRTARALAEFLKNPANQVSYHSVNDDLEVLKIVGEDMAPWSASNANHYAFHHCFAGSYASWSRDKWLDPDASDGKNEDLQLTKGAHVVAWWIDKYGIPAQWIGGGARPPWGRDGVMGHIDVGTWGGGHGDPGSNFPVNEFMRRVTELLTDEEQPPLVVMPPVVLPGTNPDKYGDWLLYRNNPSNDPERVERVQRRLVRMFSYAKHLPIDRDYSWSDDLVVRQFQTNSRLVVDGIVGPMTAAALKP